MSEQDQDKAQGSPPISGQEARRKFLRKSGSVVIAAPAAALLLSATSKNAQAIVYDFRNPV